MHVLAPLINKLAMDLSISSSPVEKEPVWLIPPSPFPSLFPRLASPCPGVSAHWLPGRECNCVCCMWVCGVCQSDYPLRLSKRLMGYALQSQNHKLSPSFQQIALFFCPIQKNDYQRNYFLCVYTSGTERFWVFL